METKQSAEHVKQIIEDVENEAFDGLEWYADRGEYLQVQPALGWEDDMNGVTVENGQIWIDGDAVSESVQTQRVAALLEAGYSAELAGTQRRGFNEQDARDILGQ